MPKRTPHAPMLRLVSEPSAVDDIADDGPPSLRQLRDQMAQLSPWETELIEAVDRIRRSPSMRRVWKKLYETQVILEFPPNTSGEEDAALNLWYCVIEPCLRYIDSNRQPRKRERLLKIARDARKLMDKIRADAMGIDIAMTAIADYALEQKARFCEDHNGSSYDFGDAASAYMMSRVDHRTVVDGIFAFRKLKAPDGTFARWRNGEVPEKIRRWMFVPDYERFAFWTAVLNSTYLPFVMKHFAEMLEREAEVPVYLQPRRGVSGAAAFMSKEVSRYMHWRHGKYLDADVGRLVAAVLGLRKDLTVNQVRDYRRAARKRHEKKQS
jgi:hypothetical protein